MGRKRVGLQYIREEDMMWASLYTYYRLDTTGSFSRIEGNDSVLEPKIVVLEQAIKNNREHPWVYVFSLQ